MAVVNAIRGTAIAMSRRDQLRKPMAVTLLIVLVGTFIVSSTIDRSFGQSNGESSDGNTVGLRLSAATLVTDQNRKQDGVMFGGWGPHLRSILRMNDDSLWYVMDHSKGDVLSNDQLFYLRRRGQSWSHVATQDLIPGVGQGCAHVTDGEEIFSYGVNFRRAQLDECRLNTKTRVPRDCAPVRDRSGEVIAIGGGGNYVGAAISAAGTRLVWWVVVTPDGSQEWRYVFNRGEGWNGPVITPLDKLRVGLSYIYVRFATENEVVLSGQFWEGQFPDGSPRATLTHFRLGQPIDGFHTLVSSDERGFPKSGSDLWIDRKTRTVHAMVEGFGDDFFGNKIHYYTFNLRDDWQELKPVQTFPRCFRARMTETARGDVFLVLGGRSGRSKLDILHVPKKRIANPIDWNAATKTAATMPGTQHYAPMAIWIENRSYQTTPVKNLNLAFTGENPQHDNEIWFYAGRIR